MIASRTSVKPNETKARAPDSFECLLPQILALILLCGICSCAPQRFYNEVKPGRIVNSPIVKWSGPDSFELVQRRDAPFEFHRFNGEVIRPNQIKTDGGSIPPQFWDIRGMTPWTYAPGYLIHDWLYEANRRGKLSGGTSESGRPLYYKKAQADWILAEVIKTQMIDRQGAKGDPNPTRLMVIYKGVQLFGKKAFKGPANPFTPHHGVRGLTPRRNESGGGCGGRMER
jgi:hypothetical protein